MYVHYNILLLGTPSDSNIVTWRTHTHTHTHTHTFRYSSLLPTNNPLSVSLSPPIPTTCRAARSIIHHVTTYNFYSFSIPNKLDGYTTSTADFPGGSVGLTQQRIRKRWFLKTKKFHRRFSVAIIHSSGTTHTYNTILMRLLSYTMFDPPVISNPVEITPVRRSHII